MDPALASVAVDTVDEHGRQLYLQTSPESAMKQLLAAGSGDIFYLGPAWRGDERGRWHAVEFTLLEWYRIGYDHHELMREVAELVAYCQAAMSRLELGQQNWQGRQSVGADGPTGSAGVGERQGNSISSADRPVEYLTYQQAFSDWLAVDPLQASYSQLMQTLARSDLNYSGSTLSRDEALDLLLSQVVSTQLGHGGITFLTGFPASQAALARLDDADPRTARRFELFMDGLEIANGYHELTDAVIQRQRFEAEQAVRQQAGLPVHAIDERLLAALESGLPECAGVALGVDRLLAVLSGAGSLAEVMVSSDNRQASCPPR